MSEAKQTFDQSIKDAEELLGHFDAINTKPPPPNAEVLKRAGLIMAFTAWETYVEDRIAEGVKARIIAAGDGSTFGNFVQRRLDEELKRFHNPTAAKTRQLFLDYLDADVTGGWRWNGYDPQKAREKLDELIGKRGDAVHRSRRATAGPPSRHFVKRDELKKTISFLKALVDATESALA